MANRVYEWVDERAGIKPAVDYVMYRRIPKSVNWFFTLGSASLTVFIVQVVTGIFLGMGYTPSTAVVLPTQDAVPSNEALQSVLYITNTIPFGGFIRGVHHWGSSLMIAVVFLHMVRVFFMGSYKYPRELTWYIGVFILLLTLAFGLTGYLLPWDNKAYWATAVTVKIAGSAPVLGEYIQQILQGGPSLGAATLTRFYAIHVLLLPILTASLIGLHLFLVVKIGISGMPNGKNKDASSEGYFEVADPKVKKTGRAFFPYIIFKDAVISVIVVAIIIALAIAKPPENSNPVTLNNSISEVLDKEGNVNKILPQPEWYFLFLFQFLKIFPPEFDFGVFKISGEAVGGIVIPTILVLALLLTPVLDRGPKRNPLNRPITSLVMLAMLIAIVGLTVWAFIDIGGQQKSFSSPPATSSLFVPNQAEQVALVSFGGLPDINYS